jgi:hypothetical protein
MEIKTGSFKNQSFLICLLLIMAIYLPVNYFGFVNMDDSEVFEKLHYNETIIDFFKIFFRDSASRYYRPLLTLSFYLDGQIWGLSFKGYHFTNYFFHVLNAVLVYLIALQLFNKDMNAKLYACLAMVLFGLHPLTCESVAWVSGRSDIAGTFFFLIAVNFYFIRKPFRFVLTPLAVFLGMLCKENALTGIPIIVLMDLFINYTQKYPVKDILKNFVIWGFVMAVPLFLYLFLRTAGWEYFTHASFSIPDNAAVVSSRGKNLFQFFHIFPVIAFYLKKLLIPFPLNFAISQINTVIYSILFFAFCLVNIIWCFKKQFSLVLWSMILVISFIPALPVAFGTIAWVPFAERYLYLSVSVTGICMAACGRYFVKKGLISFQNQWIVFIVLALIFSIATFNREFVWKNSQSLWADTLKKNPDSSVVLFGYGHAFGGETGIWAYKKAIAISKSFKYKDLAHMEIAEYERSVRNYDAAIENIDKALNIKKNFRNLCQAAKIILSIGTDDKRLEKEYTAQAIQYYQSAYKKRKTAFVLYRIGTLMKTADRQAEAMQIFKKVIHKHPNSKYALFAGTQLKNKTL